MPAPIIGPNGIVYDSSKLMALAREAAGLAQHRSCVMAYIAANGTCRVKDKHAAGVKLLYGTGKKDYGVSIFLCLLQCDEPAVPFSKCAAG